LQLSLTITMSISMAYHSRFLLFEQPSSKLLLVLIWL